MLYYTFKLFALSVDLGQIVIGELTPLLFDLALRLFPISFDAVPVHFTPPRTTSPPRGTLRHAGQFRTDVEFPRQTRVAGSDEGRRACCQQSGCYRLPMSSRGG